MSLRATGWLALATLALAAFVFWIELDGGLPGELDGRLFPGVDPAAVASIAWVSPEGRVRAARTVDGWQIVEPLVAPADGSGLDALARGIRDLSSAGRVEDPVAPDVYGLGPDATRIVFVHERQERSFTLGSETPLGGAVYGAVADRPDEVQLIPVRQAAAFDRSLDDLRDRRVLDFVPSQASRLRVAARHPDRGFQATLERRDGVWQIVAPAALEADTAAVDRLLSDLSLLRAERFVDDPGRLEEEQLATPAFVAVIEAEDEGHRLELAASGGPTSLRLVRGREDRVYLVRDALVSHLPKRLFALRSKQLARFDPEAVRVVELARNGTVLERREPEPAWLEALAALDATGVVAEALGASELAALDLSPPRLQLRVIGAGDEVLADLAFGRTDPRSGLLARVAGRETVFSVDPALEALLPFAADEVENE